ncbi:hypothetical protein ACUNWD_01305 [Sunxiuqinia sp. A32]|uniref:hypothetical protein n=1 Tax=Sunxiuqinia sp. A32 TaxID=3461496 RepID=UPI004045DD73
MENNWINKVKGVFKTFNIKDESKLIIFLICVGIATIFWFLNALNKEYKVELSFPVKYTNLPKKKVLSNEPPDHFVLEVNAYGFTILRHKLSLAFSPLVFNVNEFTGNMMEESERSYFAIPSRRFVSRISDQVSNELRVASIQPDTLYFKFDNIVSKKIKVKPDVTVDLVQQYYLNGDIRTKPDSVLISGPQSVLDTLEFISTKIQHYEKIDQVIQRNVSLSESKKYTCQPKRVVMTIPVEEFTEKQLEVPIIIDGLPEDVKINLFPSKTRLSFMTGLSRFSEINTDDFIARVSYDDILKNKETLAVELILQPPHLRGVTMSPAEVEYLIEKN